MNTHEMHPVQKPHTPNVQPALTNAVTMRAYEVYCHIYGKQEAIVTGWCRGGFSVGELLALLYARSFPQSEWRDRANEAFKGMVNL